ncbi:CPBP family intramembrane metalloprotease [Microbacterium sp. Au-Mic1]|uniref:CPBP family intramembrane glutamic endopeptidase n=1 Tax=Microbacterium sp. Au-Mic1 TaxID=2906457 RepID=UPI001E5ABAB5|nr:CPBP family intramembrane glutamic endopeptidase [Microbacterium sp. Au-Mic1]MCE4027669.1 CPBP family intramembrane metalloprotease [Microbacterium sp. Au-Mic1]
MRITPRLWIGVLVWLAYSLTVFLVGLATGIGYQHMGETTATLWGGPVLFLAAGTVLLLVAAGVLGWWRPALIERPRARHRWPIVAPAIMALAALIILSLGTDWSKIDGGYLAGLLALGVLVGFNEEFTTRGLLLVGVRAQTREVWVWFITSALFGLMHITNAFSGQPLLPTLQQVGLAFLGGTAFYIVRRVTGSLIWAMLLHGIWDISSFASAHAPGTSAIGGIVGQVGLVLALVFVFWTFRDRDEKAAPAATKAPAAANV